MGSISTNKKTGSKRYVYYDRNNQLCSIWLGKVPIASAESFQRYVDRILDARLMNVVYDAETSRWLADLSDKYYGKLVSKGFVPPRKVVPTLEECIPDIIACRASTVSKQTIEIWQQAEESLYRHFGRDRKVNTVTRIDAESFRSWLVAHGRLDGKGGLKPSTVWKRLQHVVSFFGTLAKDDVITKNPFDGLSMSPVVDEDRNEYVEEEFIYQVMDVLPDAEWRLIAALWRFGGLRGSSEPLLLKWRDVLWDKNKIIVNAKKTKRYEGKATRIIPIFPELVEPLREAFEQAAEGDVYVVTKHAPYYLRTVEDRSKLDKIKANLGSMFSDYVERAGLVPWPKIVNNLRASMENDLLNGKYGTLSIQVITDWLGHSPKVMLKHYGRVRDKDFKQVTQRQAKRQRPVNGSAGSTVKKTPGFPESPEMSEGNDDFGLTVYSTVYGAVEEGTERYGAESGVESIVSQLLNNTVLSGKKRNEASPCGNAPFSQSGEKRVPVELFLRGIWEMEPTIQALILSL